MEDKYSLTDWAIQAIEDAEKEGFTGDHCCMSAAGWRSQVLTPYLTAHLLRDGNEAADWLAAKREI